MGSTGFDIRDIEMHDPGSCICKGLPVYFFKHEIL
jgi:hypothetical protein